MPMRKEGTYKVEERELICRVIDERVEMILRKRRRKNKEVEEARKLEEAILASFDEITRRKVEELLGEKELARADEYRILYRYGFLDGLRLGHRVF